MAGLCEEISRINHGLRSQTGPWEAPPKNINPLNPLDLVEPSLLTETPNS